MRRASVIGAFGNGLTGVVLTLAIAESLGAIPMSAALTALSLGMLFSFAAGGIYADHSRRVTTLVFSDSARGVANLAVVGGIVFGGHFGVVLVVSGCAINGLSVGYFRPAINSLWAEFVPAESLKNTLATNALYSRVYLALGGAVGGILVACNAALLGLAIDAVSFFLTAFLVARIDEPEKARRGRRSSSASISAQVSAVVALLNIVGQWVQLVRIAHQSRWLPTWVITRILASLTGGVVSVCLPLVLIENYTPVLIGLFQSIGVWALVCGAVCAKIRLPKKCPGVLQSLGATLGSLAGVSVAMAWPAQLAIGLQFCAYFSTAYTEPSFTHFVAQQFCQEERGRVYALQTGVSSVLAPVGMCAAGILLQCVSAQLLLIISGSIGCVLFLIPLVFVEAWSMKVRR
ncbi:MFS transporter [Corynebacterium felinum]|uniref:MFS family permease n=1 Tax=Corynebacterium felinum TaxID=131318 RepID=A0ABU2B9C7_9CORY|nr:MFS transporter [Corynebacterium felinum]MDR7354599.1 MFS family permease [Corynebacterium felinum]